MAATARITSQLPQAGGIIVSNVVYQDGTPVSLVGGTQFFTALDGETTAYEGLLSGSPVYVSLPARPTSGQPEMSSQSGSEALSGSTAASTSMPSSDSMTLIANGSGNTSSSTSSRFEISQSSVVVIETASGTAPASGTDRTATSMPDVSSPIQGLSRADVGGIAAACVVVAAALGALVAWALMRRRLKHYQNLAAGAGAAGRPFDNRGVPEKGMGTVFAPIYGGPDTSFLAGILPVTSDDKEVNQKINSILDAAAIHVDNFYDNTKIAVPPELERELGRFASPLLQISVAEMLAQGMIPKVVIKRALTETLVSSIEPHARSTYPLLPSEFTSLPQSLHATGRNGATRQDGPALFWWRQLSVHLSSGDNPNLSYLDRRRQIIAEMVDNFQTAFRPWRKTRYTEKQEREALAGTLTSTADTGVWLFSQRSGFSFLWGRATPPGELETRPALMKTSDENGLVLSKPREIVQRKLEREGSGAL